MLLSTLNTRVYKKCFSIGALWVGAERSQGMADSAEPTRNLNILPATSTQPCFFLELGVPESLWGSGSPFSIWESKPVLETHIEF